MSVGGGAIKESREGVVEGGGRFGGGGRGYDEVNNRRVCGAGKLTRCVCMVSKGNGRREGKDGRGKGEGGGEGVGGCTLMMLSDTQLRRSAIVAWLELLLLGRGRARTEDGGSIQHSGWFAEAWRAAWGVTHSCPSG